MTDKNIDFLRLAVAVLGLGQEYIKQSELQSAVIQAVDELQEREQSVIRQRFSHRRQTLEEVAQYFGVTRERIRQVEARALRKLRAHATKSSWMSRFVMTEAEVVVDQLLSLVWRIDKWLAKEDDGERKIMLEALSQTLSDAETRLMQIYLPRKWKIQHERFVRFGEILASRSKKDEGDDQP